MITCWQRDVLFCLHDSGSVSAHFRRRLLPILSSPDGDKENTWHGGRKNYEPFTSLIFSNVNNLCEVLLKNIIHILLILLYNICIFALQQIMEVQLSSIMK